jgi:hypothetical protein
MKRLLAIGLLALTLASCGSQYATCCPGVDGGRASKGCVR